MSSQIVVGETTCANCGASLQGPYCSGCGQRTAPGNPPLRPVLRDLLHELLDLDGKVFRSVQRLLFRPGELTLDYFEGRRARSLTPIRLYLVFSVLYLTAATLSVGDSGEPNDPGSRLIQETVGDVLTHWIPRAMFVLVPLFAAVVHALVRRRGHRYPRQLFFALHVHAAWFAALAIASAADHLPWQWAEHVIDALLAAYGGWYLWKALRTTYGGGYAANGGRSLVIAVVYGVLVFTTVIALALAVFASRAATGELAGG